MIAWWAAAALASSLEGRITDASGAPVPNTTVVAYDHRLSFANVTSGSDGAFTFPSLSDGPWRIRVIPNAAVDLSEEWAQDTLSVCEAQVFQVGGDAPIVDVALDVGASLHGRVDDDLGQGLPGVLVSARAVDAPTAFLRAALTDASGEFTVRGLPTWTDGTARYRLEADVDGWPVQQLGGGYLAAEALVFEVVRGEDHEVGPFGLKRGVVVSGTALGPSGEPIWGEVRAFSGNQVVEGFVTEGAWSVDGLPPGQVLPWIRAEGYATTWWPDSDRPGERVAVLEEGEVREGVDLVLPAESRLLGRLAGDAPTGDIGVLAYNDDQTVGTGAVANELGDFAVGRLHGGSYTLFVFGSSHGFVDDFVRGGDGEPRVFEVPDQADTTSTDVLIERAAVLSGTVTDAVTGLPVYGATVHAEGQASGVVKVIGTARDGTWTIQGMPADAWAVWVDYQHYCPNDPGWAPIHHPDRVNPALVEVIQLGPGDEATWDALLPPDDDHDGMDDAWEEDHGLDPTRDDSIDDSDGDGFVNVAEYLLGTDPNEVVDEEDDGCAGCGGGQSLLPMALFPWWRRRRVG